MIALGIDVGTSSTKVLALSDDGAVGTITSSSYHLQADGTVVEVDAEDWWRATCEALRTWFEQTSTDSRDIAAIGLTGNMSSIVLVDEHNAAIRPAILLADPRGADQLASIDPDLKHTIEAMTGNKLGTIFTLGKLLWLRDNAAQDIARARCWLTAKDYVRLRLTGYAASDLSDGFNALLIRTGETDWAWNVIQELRLPQSLFPTLVPSASIAGGLSREAAAATGLAEGTPVAVGAADMATVAVGSDAVRTGYAAISLGTSTTFQTPLGNTPFPPEWHGKLGNHPLPAGNSYYALAGLLTGGLALDWLRTTLASPEEIRTASPDPSNSLMFLPHLGGLGSPDYDSVVRGTILGLTPNTTGGDLAAALFEAIAFELRSIVDLVRMRVVIDHLVVGGGGANLPIWPQLISDVLMMPVEVVACSELSALGAAILAWQVLQPASAGADQAKSSHKSLVSPRPEHAAAWEDKRTRYMRALAVSRRHYHSA